MPTMTIAIIIFAITYLSLLIFSNYRAYIALGSAAIFVALGIWGGWGGGNHWHGRGDRHWRGNPGRGGSHWQGNPGRGGNHWQGNPGRGGGNWGRGGGFRGGREGGVRRP